MRITWYFNHLVLIFSSHWLFYKLISIDKPFVDATLFRVQWLWVSKCNKWRDYWQHLKISKSLFIMIRTLILHSADMEKVRICDLQDLNINNLKYQVVDKNFVISFHVWYLALLRVSTFFQQNFFVCFWKSTETTTCISGPTVALWLVETLQRLELCSSTSGSSSNSEKLNNIHIVDFFVIFTCNV